MTLAGLEFGYAMLGIALAVCIAGALRQSLRWRLDAQQRGDELADSLASHEQMRQALDLVRRNLDADRMLREGYEDRLESYQQVLSCVLAEVDGAMAFFDKTGHLILWTEAFSRHFYAGGDRLEVGRSFESMMPMMIPVGGPTSLRDDGASDLRRPCICSIGKNWQPGLYSNADGTFAQARCRRSTQGWVLVLELDEASAVGRVA